jgi:predicted NBD/HSP70 family sugar kinase
VRRVLVLNIGPEITATQIIDGVPDVGATGLAGMVGRALIWEDGVTRRLEDVAGSFAVKQRYADISGTSVDWMSEVWDRAREGDADAEATMAVHLDAVAHAAMWLITIANPERFVVTGAGGALLERWRARLHSTIVELTDPRLLRDCTIRFTDLGQEAWIRGGVHAVLDHRRGLEHDDLV